MEKNGIPLALLEATRSRNDPITGKGQASLCWLSLGSNGVRPFIFYTNGFETYFWDDTQYAPRQVSFIFCKNELEKLMNRRNSVKDLSTIETNDTITDRYYQKEGIRAVCHHFTTGHRKALLVIATGTGKTRTASNLADVFSRGNFAKNILFLANRKGLVGQAHDDFQKNLPNSSLCNLLHHKEEKNVRIIFLLSNHPKRHWCRQK